MRLFGIIGPNPEEIDHVIDKIEDAEIVEHGLLRFHRGQLYNQSVVVVESGICKCNAAISAQILIDTFQVTDLIVVGVAGAIADLEIEDTVIGTKTAHHDVVSKFLREGPPYNAEDGFFLSDNRLIDEFKSALKDYDHTIYYGPIVSGEFFVDQAGRAEIIENFDPLVVDMETAGAHHAAFVNNIPFISIRSITDTQKESGIETFRQNYELSRNRAQDILFTYLRSLNV